MIKESSLATVLKKWFMKAFLEIFYMIPLSAVIAGIMLFFKVVLFRLPADYLLYWKWIYIISLIVFEAWHLFILLCVLGMTFYLKSRYKASLKDIIAAAIDYGLYKEKSKILKWSPDDFHNWLRDKRSVRSLSSAFIDAAYGRPLDD